MDTAPQNAIESTVKVSELLGAEVYLYFDINGIQVTARVNPRSDLKAGILSQLYLIWKSTFL